MDTTTSSFWSLETLKWVCCCSTLSYDDDEKVPLLSQQEEAPSTSTNLTNQTPLLRQSTIVITSYVDPAATSASDQRAKLKGNRNAKTTTTKITSLMFPKRNFKKSNKKAKSVVKSGYAWIFNNFAFNGSNVKTNCIGSADDIRSLKETFKLFEIQTKVRTNPTLKKIKKTVRKIETTNFDDYACLIIVILSHGSRHEEIAAKDGHYSIDDHILFPLLKNPTLNDKPKLFFIQACKGSMESSGYYKDATPFVQRGSPSEILKCYSTFEGFVSYRTEKGSIFIQTLCQQLKQSGGHTNIKAIMDTVITSVKEQTQNKQIPSYSSTLTKPFVIGDYLKK